MAADPGVGRFLLLVAVLGSALAGCSTPQAPAGLRGSPMVVAEEDDGVCGLLASEELELVLNAPVESTSPSPAAGRPGEPESTTAQVPGSGGAEPITETPSTRGWPQLLPGMRMCRAMGQEGRILWGVLTADQADEPVAELFEAYRDWHGDDVDALRVDGQPAVWDEELRILLVLADDHAVGVQLTIPNPPGAAAQSEEREDGSTDDDGEDTDGAHDEPVTLGGHLDEDKASYLRAQAIELASRASGRR